MKVFRTSFRSVSCAIVSIAFVLPQTQAGPELTIGRLQYDGGGDWYANPSSIPNLLEAVRNGTVLDVAERERVVRLSGPELWEIPFLHMTGHGNVRFSDAERDSPSRDRFRAGGPRGWRLSHVSRYISSTRSDLHASILTGMVC